MITKMKIKMTIIFVVTAIFLAGCVSGSNDTVQKTIEARAEKQWTQILGTIPVSTDEGDKARVQNVSVRLLQAAGEDPSRWRIVLFDKEDTVNAFALPNRTIGIFTGLTKLVSSDDQLGTVIGHEIAHVKLRHVEARLTRGLAPGILIGVAKLPGEVTGIGAAKTVGGLAGGVVAAGTVLPFDRRQELNADLEGLHYLADSGYDPSEAANLWRALDAMKDGEGVSLPEFLSTHPGHARRISALEEEALRISKGQN